MPNWYAMPTTLSCWRAIKVHVCKAGSKRKIEKWLRLEINRDKTRVVDLREEKASLDFLGHTFSLGVAATFMAATGDICTWDRRRRRCKGSGIGLTN